MSVRTKRLLRNLASGVAVANAIYLVLGNASYGLVYAHFNEFVPQGTGHAIVRGPPVTTRAAALVNRRNDTQADGGWWWGTDLRAARRTH